MNAPRALLALFVLPFASSACGAPPARPSPAPPPVARPVAAEATPPEAAPTLRLPEGVRPTAESLVLTIDPSRDRYSGVAEIALTLDRPRAVVWLHGKGLHVTRATITPAGGAEVAAEWAARDPSGIASVTAPRSLPAGRATLRIAWDAPFGGGLEGLYKVTQAGVPYAFTQFEPMAARLAFPCFDEPSFKIPFDVTLVVPKGAQAIANGPEIARVAEAGGDRVRFATTPPLPSYLVAFAVGDLDVVRAPDVPPNEVRKRPLPLRAVTAKGRGGEVAYALAHTGEIVATLERYFGSEYPFAKLDVLAVPDKGGAMENAGAITFQDYLLLMDEKTAPLAQKRAYAVVMAHELAHQWVGDLVTMAWWDDTWLNEAFATWMAAKAADAWDPRTHAHLALLGAIGDAMRADALVSARAVRQPIASPHDVTNAFDAITYRKGGALLAMFEQWVGEEAFQRGVREYLGAHRFGNAVADDFLRAVSKAAGKDVATPFRTFLDRPGLPFVEAEVRCDGGAPRVHLAQSRFLPLGSRGDAKVTPWQIPVCVRYAAPSADGGKGGEARRACTLLADREGDLPLDACPAWALPNADATGYFRFALAPADFARLRAAGPGALSVPERVAFAGSVYAATQRGTLPMKEALDALAPLAADPHPEVGTQPMAMIARARDWMFDDPQLRSSIEAYGRALYRAPMRELGWTAAKGDDEDRRTRRAAVVTFVALVARDPAVRAEAKRRALAYLGYRKDGALHLDALDPDLAQTALTVAGEDADAALWDAMRARLATTEDPAMRARLVAALSAAKDPALAARARALSLDPALRGSEALGPLRAQLASPDTREAAWAWMKEHQAALASRASELRAASSLLGNVAVFCDEAHADDAERSLTPRAATMPGGPRALATALEHVRLCAAQRKQEEASARDFFRAAK